MGRLAKSVGPRVALLLLTTLSASALRVQGQSENPYSSVLATRPQRAEPPSTSNEIRVRANEVVVPVTVTDKKGEPVLDLTQKDFHVFDTGIEQRIDRWDLDNDPIATVLVIETSAHIQSILPVVHRAGNVFTETVMALSGEAAVVSYDDRVEIRQPFTTDHNYVEEAIEKLPSGSLGMKLYDAMARANSLLQSQPTNWRRVMLVIGEAQDAGSVHKLGEILRVAQLSNVSIYAIGVSSIRADFWSGPKKRSHVSPPTTGVGVDLSPLVIMLVELGTNEVHNHALEVSAAATGGTLYRTLKDHTIQNALDDIGGSLHTQYSLNYQPSGDAQPGYHEIKVTVSRPGVAIRTRPGYFLAATGN
jgi:VWFA-related protein